MRTDAGHGLSICGFGLWVDLPAEADVETGVDYAHGDKTGTFVGVPADAVVRVYVDETIEVNVT